MDGDEDLSPWLQRIQSLQRTSGMMFRKWDSEEGGWRERERERQRYDIYAYSIIYIYTYVYIVYVYMYMYV